MIYGRRAVVEIFLLGTGYLVHCVCIAANTSLPCEYVI